MYFDDISEMLQDGDHYSYKTKSLQNNKLTFTGFCGIETIYEVEPYEGKLEVDYLTVEGEFKVYIVSGDTYLEVGGNTIDLQQYDEMIQVKITGCNARGYYEVRLGDLNEY